jgi:hypothetical protein
MKEYSSGNNHKSLILYISIGDLISKRIIVDYFPQGKGNEHKYKEYARNIINKLLTIAIRPNERYKESVDMDSKFNVSMDSKANIAFMILTNDNYPERYAYKLLMELETKSISTIYKHYINKNIGDILALSEYFKNFAKDIQLYMVQLEREYRSHVENDKIRLIQEDIDDVKIDVKKKIDKMLTNIELVSNLEEKSNALRDVAKEFKTGGKDLKRATWRRSKVTLVAGGLSIGAVLYFGIRFFLK